MRAPLIYHQHPIFGFDLGTRAAKLVQLKRSGKTFQVVGYGYAQFPEEAIVEGIIVDPQEIATALKPLMHKMSYGHITATRIAAALPVAKVFTRVLTLPPMNEADLDAAVHLEVEQYVPVPLPDLYIDFEIIDHTDEQQEVLMVAAPRAIVDSYLKLFELMNLEVAFIESSLSAATRAIVAAEPLEKVTLVADFGSVSIDLTVLDRVIRLTDTVALGGDTLTKKLVADLGITAEQAHEIKFKFGIAKSGLQPKIQTSLAEPLQKISVEMKRVVKYYQDRSAGKRPVEALILSGGSAGMPGLVEYLAKELGIPVTIADPWTNLKFKQVQRISAHDEPMYTTAIGLARLEGSI